MSRTLIENVRDISTLILVAMLPWQARYIFYLDTLNNYPWEPGTLSVYVIDIVIVVLFLIVSIYNIYHTTKSSRVQLYVLLFIMTFPVWLVASTLLSISLFLSLSSHNYNCHRIQTQIFCALPVPFILFQRKRTVGKDTRH